MNQCPHAQTSVRTVPLDLVQEGTRIPGAELHTCTTCGASFYREETLLLQAREALPAPPADAGDTWEFV